MPFSITPIILLNFYKILRIWHAFCIYIIAENQISQPAIYTGGDPENITGIGFKNDWDTHKIMTPNPKNVIVSGGYCET